METQILKPTEVNILKVATALKQGDVVGMPTETVYGLATNALDTQAVQQIFALKGRPANNPLIVHVSSVEQAEELCYLSEDAKILAQHFWPGPLTLLLPKKPCVPSVVNAGLDTVAIRIPKSSIARELIAKSGIPIAAPSANLSGKPSPTTPQHVYDDFHGKISFILDGGVSNVGLESTVLNLATKPYTILRPGGITLSDLTHFFPNVALSNSLLKPVEKNEIAESPGMLYKHYATDAPIFLLQGTEHNISAFAHKVYSLAMSQQKSVRFLCFKEHLLFFPKQLAISIGSQQNLTEVAHNLFATLRQLDKENIDLIFSESTVLDGIGLAIMNRLMRAAAFKVIDVNASTSCLEFFQEGI